MDATSHRFAAATASIWAQREDAPEHFIGNGVFVSPNCVLTARHVAPKTGVWVRNQVEPMAPVLCAGEAIQYHPDPDLDVALLRLPVAPPGVTVMPVSDYNFKRRKVTHCGFTRTTSGILPPGAEQRGLVAGPTSPAIKALAVHGSFPNGSSGSGMRRHGWVCRGQCRRALVGIVVERAEDRDKSVGYVVPVSAFGDWLLEQGCELVPSRPGRWPKITAAALAIAGSLGFGVHLLTTRALPGAAVPSQTALQDAACAEGWRLRVPDFGVADPMPGRWQLDAVGSFGVEQGASGAKTVLVFSSDAHRFDSIAIERGRFMNQHGEVCGSNCPTDGYAISGRFVAPDRAEGEIAYAKDCRVTERRPFVAQLLR